MKVLVTGSSGLLGKKILELFSPNKNFEVHGTFFTHKNDRLHFLDITDKNSVQKYFANYQPDILIHCAALVDADQCERDKEKCEKINLIGTINLAEACKNKNCLFIFISSDYIFDGEDTDYSEYSMTHPLNFYGTTKVEGEAIVKNLNNYIIVRPPLMYGEDENTKPSFITEVLRKLKNDEEIYLDNTITKYPTLTDDVAHGILTLINNNARGIYNLASEEGITRYEWAKRIAHYYGYSDKNIIEKTNKTEARRPLHVKLLSSKIKNMGLNFATIEEGLHKTFQPEFVKKYAFKIIRSDEIPLEDRRPYGGYFIKRLFTEPLCSYIENIGFYETIIPPHNQVNNHYHDNVNEIFYFFSKALLKIGAENITVNSGDIIILPKGVPHEVIANDEEVRLLAIKIPNLPHDKIIY